MTEVVTPSALAHPRRTALVVAGMLLLAVAVVGVWVSEPDPCRAGAVAALGTRPSGGFRSVRPVPAREHLLRMAGSVTTVPAESEAGVAYHHQRRWILDTTGTPARSGVCEDTPAVFAVDIRRWEAVDGSGRGIEVENWPDYALTGAHPGFRSTGAEFAAGTTRRIDYPVGNRRSPITVPLASDSAGLAAQLAAVDPMPDGPQAMVRAVDELYASHYVDLPVRRAVFQVLADVAGLSFSSGVADRLGRTGDAVVYTAAGVEYLLVFDPATGRLLASQQRSTGGHEYLPAPPGLVRYYILYVEQGRRPVLG
ncbi:hypothetical protein RB614_37460 [Phytohabitans sp. ZYX-F-186]|uniref:CU044_5270 family protein n=1 Tax=Phytohabitans maris TaxID=3071409 RepID=A0ABU0ZT36_9ACTN|nr:hypothetical protein [Phytohabitans sp. ZYX-F-186]MDQ7910199.1 hypothetical protein [Phytohabitans sp. ZYX-F-186]